MPFPTSVAAAADDPQAAPGRVSLVSAFAAMAGLASPPLVGLLGDWLGLRTGLLFLLVALAVAALVAKANGQVKVQSN